MNMQFIVLHLSKECKCAQMRIARELRMGAARLPSPGTTKASSESEKSLSAWTGYCIEPDGACLILMVLNPGNP